MRTPTHTLSVLVQNQPGALARISGLFARRGFNIDSLAVGETEDPQISRMTIVVRAGGPPVEQITKQLHKLINVLRIAEIEQAAAVERELALIKVAAGPTHRSDVAGLGEIFRARIVDVDTESMVFEVAGAPEKITALEDMLRPYGIIEMARTGRIALGRGAAGLKPPSLRPVDIADRSVS